MAIQKYLLRLSAAPKRKIFGGLLGLLLIAALPVTVLLSLHEQDLRQRAASLDDDSYLHHILITGQSLSIGYQGQPPLSTAQPYNNLELKPYSNKIQPDSSYKFAPLVEDAVPIDINDVPYNPPGASETIGSSMANTIDSLANDPNYQILVSRHGIAGAEYSSIKKGTQVYANSINSVRVSKMLAAGIGKKYEVSAITLIHGEADSGDNTGMLYEQDIEQFQENYQSDIEAITEQSGTIPLFTDQVDSFNNYQNHATSPIPIAQLAAAENNPGKIYLVAPKYFLKYHDTFHLLNTSYRLLGEYYGKVMKQVLIDDYSL